MKPNAWPNAASLQVSLYNNYVNISVAIYGQKIVLVFPIVKDEDQKGLSVLRRDTCHTALGNTLFIFDVVCNTGSQTMSIKNG